MQNANLEAALKLANDPAHLESTLRRSVRFQPAEIRPLFQRARFHRRERKIVTPCGRYAIQWQTRRHPDAPIGPGNTQKRWGYTRLIELETAARAA